MSTGGRARKKRGQRTAPGETRVQSPEGLANAKTDDPMIGDSSGGAEIGNHVRDRVTQAERDEIMPLLQAGNTLSHTVRCATHGP